MPKLRELSYQEVTRRLLILGFRFYRQGKGSHELWVRDADGRVVPVPHYRGKKIRKGTVREIIREVGVSLVWYTSLKMAPRQCDVFVAMASGCVGLPIVVQDAHPDVIHHARYQTRARGGHGAVREICDLFERVLAL